ncbi:sialate O-acetylesterase [Candidatus Hydrogenedentota bacterium]
MLYHYSKLLFILLVAAVALVQVPTVFADVTPHALFSDGMVLQCGIEAPVWGRADPGEKIVVRFGAQRIETVADSQGEWSVKLSPMKTRGPSSMVISGKNTVEINNILIGEVWVCGGQSNMQFTLKKCDGGEEAVANSANNNLRLFKVPPVGSEKPLKNVDAQWEICGPEVVADFSGVGYFFGKELGEALDVPIGLIQACKGGTAAELWTSMDALSANPALKPMVDKFLDAWKNQKTSKKEYDQALTRFVKAREEAKATGKPMPQRPGNPLVKLSHLYNGTIAPLQPYGIRGAIWYQGEANASSTKRAQQYREIFPTMIRNWRDDWGQGNFPFLFVQLPGFKAPAPRDWPVARESQASALSLPNTGMAVAIDLGDPNDIHPTNKKPVGQRLSLVARAKVYREEIEYSGPRYREMRITDGKIEITFEHVAGGLVVKGDELRGFEIAGDDGKFAPATASIEGGSVVVSNSDVSSPKAVRYAWAAVPKCNLYNKAGLSAAPFRTNGASVVQFK